MRSLWRETLDALSGRNLVRAALARTPVPALHVRIVALGKAALSMAWGAVDALRVDRISGVVASHEPGRCPEGLRLLVGAHPLPDESSAAAGRALMEASASAAPDDFTLYLVSGGGSSIACLPVEGLGMEDMAKASEALLKAGIPIDGINIVRRQLNQVADGGLARVNRSRNALAMMVSDVPSGDASMIASGPVSQGAGGAREALSIAVGPEVRGFPEAALEHLRRLAAAEGKPGDGFESCADPVDMRRERQVRCRVLADPRSMGEKVAEKARGRGVAARIVVQGFQGPLEELAETMARRALEELEKGSSTGSGPECGENGAQPVLLIATGEPALAVPSGCGTGGRMQTLALMLASALAGRDVAVLCAGSDGRDGPTDLAGAVADGDTCPKADEMGVDLKKAVEGFDATPAVQELGIGIPRFSSGTNLTDLCMVCCFASGLDKGVGKLL